MPIKNEEAYEKIIKMSRNNDYKTGNLLDLSHFKDDYKLIAIDLSTQTNSIDPQQINRVKQWSNDIFHHWKIRRNYFWIFTKFCEHLIKMETPKIVNLLNSSDNKFSKFATKKWYVIDSESNGGYLHHDPIKAFDKVTTGTYNFVSVIWNSNPVGATIAAGWLLSPAVLTVTSANAQFLDKVKINSISPLINGIFKVLQKLLSQ